ncbi:calcium/sodium antiporter [Cellulosilyticum ruminicola]|uniref:calcium/sodium antiporter n=1 Tax=Cellulosilyticum ruminicola TaxID=425254 RepID=UPI0006D015CF|nr:calcium/sodium antiporter [Cellulosilyticum ruminicola]
MAYILLIIGFVLLVKGSDYFVDGSSSIAQIFHIPTLIIGLTIVAFGTSAPEAAVSITAALKGQNDIAMGNVIGSNIFNTLVVVGGCAIITPFAVEDSVLKQDFPFSILITVALLFLGSDSFLNNGVPNVISRGDGLTLLLFFIVFIYNMIQAALKNKHQEEDVKPKYSLGKGILIALGGIVGIVLGGELVVDSASKIAISFGLSETLVGLTIVAIGTSLPELVTSLVASKKGKSDIAIGNVVGSNIFNILLVLALSASIHPINVNVLSIYDLLILLGFNVITYIFAWIQKRVGRIEGSILVILYILYTVYIIIR